MTCIVGIIHKKKVYIAGDSLGVADYHSVTRADEKVFKVGTFIFGFTSSYRMGQLLRYTFKPPIQKCKDDYEYMVKDFIPAIQKCFEKGGFLTEKDKEKHGGTFLVGYKGSLYNIEGDFQVGKSSFNYDAVGCGYELALGALYILTKMSVEKPKEILIKALEAATEFSAAVKPPYKTINL